MAALYIHIPYCHSKCAYCDFFSIPVAGRDITATIDAIKREYEGRLTEMEDQSFRTIYFGGGTPSCVPADTLHELCSGLPMHEAEERTIEVNPEDVTFKVAESWLKMGFNRVSMGVQSLVDSELQAVGRRHTAAQALQALGMLRQVGFANISVDLIFGLPGQSLKSWSSSLDTLLAASPEHLSAYCLSYEPHTRLTARLKAGKLTPTDDDTLAEMYALLCHRASEAGFEHYEISNFAQPNFHSRHNSSYWDGTPYLGLGPGAHSCDVHGLRRYNPSNIAEWMRTGAMIEEETDTERLNDRIMTALRTSAGLNLSDFSDDDASGILERAARHIAIGNIAQTDCRLRIPEHRWLVSDAIICDILAF